MGHLRWIFVGAQKAGIMLYDISNNKMQQLSLLEPNLKSNPELMQALDSINSRYGKGTLQYDSETAGAGWQMVSTNLMPSYNILNFYFFIA